MGRKNKNTTDAAQASPTSNDSASSPENAKNETGPLVTVLKTATAQKLSPRGDGPLTYQVGRMDDTVLLRIFGNESSGRFSKEWVALDAVRLSLAQIPKGVASFKGATALKSAWKGQSSCNSGFGAAILRAEDVFAVDDDPKKKGLLRLASPDALDAWEQRILALDVSKDAERVPLNPPKPTPFFAKRGPKSPGDDTGVKVDSVDDPDVGESVEDEA